MLHLVVPSLKNQEKGFNLIEIAAILVIIGIAGAIGTPSLVNARRQDQVNQAHSRIRSTLVEAQINANRLSSSCTVTIGSLSPTDPTKRLVTASPSSPSGCVLETIDYESSVVSVSRGSPTSGNLPNDVTYTFRGTVEPPGAQTIWVARKDFDGTVLQYTAKCIVVSPVGMIRTGIIDSSGGCYNVENDRYDSSTQ